MFGSNRQIQNLAKSKSRRFLEIAFLLAHQFADDESNSEFDAEQHLCSQAAQTVQLESPAPEEESRLFINRRLTSVTQPGQNYQT